MENIVEKSLPFLMAGIVVDLFGGFDSLFNVLLIFIVLDFITGILNSAMKHELKSIKCYRGILKKICILTVVIMSVQIDNLEIVNLPLRSAILTFFIANEGMSIIENISNYIPLPKKLTNLFENMIKESEE